MENRLTKIKNWITDFFQFITVGLLTLLIALILKQQNDISSLKSRLDWIESSMDNIENKVDDVEDKVDNMKNKIDVVENKMGDMEYNLSRGIDDIKSTVRIYSH
ncbi:MAG: hypothetical protein KF900_02370 [Bacteroidetes bacterium]|nr:hypothetical protein [Bacteroidota bacterium]